MEKEVQCLKNGFLLRLEQSKKWKIRWFTLEEDQLVCHPKRDRYVVIDTINLHGASVVCPSLTSFKAENLGEFHIHTPKGEELCFRASGKEDCDGWAHAIGAVLRSLTVSNQDSEKNVPFQPFRVNTNVSEILGALQEPEAGVELGSHVRNGDVHKNCFEGHSIVDWLERWSIIRRRDDGVAMAQTLLKLGHLQEVDILDGAAGAARKFVDGDKLYRFTSLNLGMKRNSFYDSTDSESSSSEDEDDTTEDLTKLRKGKIIKAGYLWKRKNIRKEWRVRRVTVHQNPSVMAYSRPVSPEGIEPKYKVIELNRGSLQESKKAGGNKSKMTIKDQTGRLHVFKFKDEAEKSQWMTVVQPLCQSIKPKEPLCQSTKPKEKA
ncbi:pleckstrin-2-like [Mytilus galloprovincialis]|uniref:Pleckstrin n=1 Tax=Mytilus galloprovincialis TaxID=29158 RepID=A0A8B6BXB3_MYTGA|nr:pleckstrin [Mytilus galloprovincialis]